MSLQTKGPPPELGADPETHPSGEASSGLLELVLSEVPAPPIDGIVVGRVLHAGDVVRITYPGCPEPGGVPARSMVRLGPPDQGAAVALMFELGDPARPCVLGRMALRPSNAPPPPDVEVARDGERIVLRAEQGIVLACGDASITLTRAGKVLIRGEYVLSASTGVHRILGASVEIN